MLKRADVCTIIPLGYLISLHADVAQLKAHRVTAHRAHPPWFARRVQEEVETSRYALDPGSLQAATEHTSGPVPGR